MTRRKSIPRCLCGNKIEDEYFYPCDVEGRDYEEGDADTNLAVCGLCGRIWDCLKRVPVGQRAPGILPNFCRLPLCAGESLVFSEDGMYCGNEYCPRFKMLSDEIEANEDGSNRFLEIQD